MDARTRAAVEARDQSVFRVRRLTRRIGTFGLAGGLLLGAGFAGLLPSHLPHLGGNGTGSGDGTGTSTGDGGGLQGPANAPAPGGGAPSHVTSGGS
jgi:hypothetical protein